MTQSASKVTFESKSSNSDDVVPVTRPVLIGYSINEVAGTPAAWEVNIYDGTVSGGQKTVVAQNSSGDTSEIQWFGPNGIMMHGGVSIEVVTGTVDIILYYETG